MLEQGAVECLFKPFSGGAALGGWATDSLLTLTHGLHWPLSFSGRSG